MGNIKLEDEVHIQNILFLTHPDSGSTDEEARGVVSGVVTALMSAFDVDLENAILFVADKIPKNHRPGLFPKHWIDRLSKTQKEIVGNKAW